MKLLIENPLAGQLPDEDPMFSPTGLQSFKCPRLFYLDKVLGISPKVGRPYFAFGSALHYAVGLFYTLKGGLSRDEDILELCEQKFPDVYQPVGLGMKAHEVIRTFAQKAFAIKWKDEAATTDEKRNYEAGIYTVGRYCDHYQSDTTEYLADYIECKFALEMPNGTILRGIIDRVKKLDGYTAIVDTKSSSGYLTEYGMSEFAMDFQTTIYYYAGLELLEEVDAVEIDAIKVPQPKDVEKGFVRRAYPRTEKQISEAVNTYLHQTDRILAGLQNFSKSEQPSHFYMETTQCNAYGGCKFQPICMHGLDKVDGLFNFELERILDDTGSTINV